MTELFNTLTPYLTIIGIVAGLVLAFFNKADREKDFQRWIQRNSIAERYHALLRWLLRRAQHFYGSLWLSRQAFNFSLLLAYLYPVLATLIAYALANNTKVAGLELFDAQDNALLRWLLLLALLVTFEIMIWIWRNYGRINTWCDALSQRLSGSRLLGRLLLALVVAAACLLYIYYLSGDIYWNDSASGIFFNVIFTSFAAALAVVAALIAGANGNFALAVAFAAGAALAGAGTLAGADALAGAAGAAYAYAFAVVFAGAGASVGAGTIADALARYFADTSARVFAAASTIAIYIAGAIAMSFYISGDYANTQSVILLYLLLPFINALFDYVSVKYSRYFSTRIAAGEGAWMVSMHLLLDAVLALLFFFGLLLALPPLIDGYNWLCSDSASLLPPIDWRELALQARDDPWGAGFLVTLMLLSTLIPTLLHLLMAALALGGRGLALGWFARGMQKNSMYVLGLAIWLGVLAVAILAVCYWLWQALSAWLRLDITGALYNLLMLVYANGWQYAVLALVSIALLTLMRWRLDDAEQIHAKAQARSAT